VVPIWPPHALVSANADRTARSEDIAAAAATIRQELRKLGRREVAD
jgi:hypothetical protein